MAEWLRSGLQIRARRFDSGSGLQVGFHKVQYGKFLRSELPQLVRMIRAESREELSRDALWLTLLIAKRTKETRFANVGECEALAKEEPLFIAHGFASREQVRASDRSSFSQKLREKYPVPPGDQKLAKPHR